MTDTQRAKIKAWFEDKKPYYQPSYYSLKDEHSKKLLKLILIMAAIIGVFIFGAKNNITPNLSDSMILIGIGAVIAIYYSVPVFKLSSRINDAEAEYRRLNNLYLARISTKELDELINMDKQDLQEKGMDELNLNNDELKSDTIYVKSIADISTSRGQDLATKDDEIRFNIMKHNFFYFKENKLAIYSVDFNHSLGKAVSSVTEEIHYKDITNIRVETKDDDFIEVYCSQTYMQIGSAGGERLRIFMNSDDFITNYRKIMTRKYEEDGNYQEAQRLKEISENAHLEVAENAKTTINVIRHMTDEAKS
jgi:hypothetical protein